jgi:lipid-binding SYLF domain-containing protein
MKAILIAALATCPALVFAADSQADAMKRIHAASEVFSEIMSAPDKGIPHEVLEKAQCIGIVPSLKRAGFIVGAKYGKGILTCRAKSGWSAPSTIIIEGGSVGFQIGAGETDLVFVVMNPDGEEKLMKDKFTFGGDAAAMAGPVGRSAEAQTDAMLHAEILSYSRARGLFAGISLDGSTLRPDKEANRALYGREVMQREVLTGAVPHPAGSGELYSTLERYAPVGRRSAHS